MSTSWSSPDPRPRAALEAVPGAPAASAAVPGAPAAPAVTAVPAPPPLRDDLRAALVTLVATVLAGAPLGLLWAALAPRVTVVVVGEDVNLTEAYTDGFIAADAYFLAAVAVAGLVGGLLAWRLGSAHGPAVVMALTVAGLVAAYVAMEVGQQIGVPDLREAVRAGRSEPFELPLRLQAREALVGWPLASLLGWLAASLPAATRPQGEAAAGSVQ